MTAGIGQVTTPGAAAGTPAPGSEQAKIREAATRLEGVFLTHLVDQMMKGTGLSESQPIYSGLLSEKLGDHLATVGGFGLAALVESQLGGAGDAAVARGTEVKEKP
jgi:Rod binding domain-containing protein